MEFVREWKEMGPESEMGAFGVYKKEVSAMRRIPQFRSCTEAIVSNLALLNDYAIEIYERHNHNAAEAMKELSVKALECTGDPAHKAYLKFPFSYLGGIPI